MYTENGFIHKKNYGYTIFYIDLGEIAKFCTQVLPSNQDNNGGNNSSQEHKATKHTERNNSP